MGREGWAVFFKLIDPLYCNNRNFAVQRVCQFFFLYLLFQKWVGWVMGNETFHNHRVSYNAQLTNLSG